ncbi:MAG: hypothetical protein RR821_12220 [Clostridia bacterium]
MRTFLKVLSVLLIVGAVLVMVMGLLGFVGGGVFTGAGFSNYFEQDTGMGVAAMGIVAIFAGILAILMGVFDLLTGIFGFKGANGNTSKLKVALVLNWISVGLSVVRVIMAISAQTEIVDALLTVLFPALFAFVALFIQKADAAESSQAQSN